jgi:hypothetical protein
LEEIYIGKYDVLKSELTTLVKEGEKLEMSLSTYSKTFSSQEAKDEEIYQLPIT